MESTLFLVIERVNCGRFRADGFRKRRNLKNTFRVWNPSTGKQVGRPLKGHKQWITSVSWQPMHASKGVCELFASSSKCGNIKIWNARAGTQLASLSVSFEEFIFNHYLLISIYRDIRILSSVLFGEDKELCIVRHEIERLKFGVWKALTLRN